MQLSLGIHADWSLTTTKSIVQLYLVCGGHRKVQNLNAAKFVYFIRFFNAHFALRLFLNIGLGSVKIGYTSIPHATKRIRTVDTLCLVLILKIGSDRI